MPPRAFPYALRIGTDICHIPRVQRLISREIKNDPTARPVGLYKTLQKLMTDKEQDAFWLSWKSPANIFETTELRLNNVAGYIAGRSVMNQVLCHMCRPNTRMDTRSPSKQVGREGSNHQGGQATGDRV